jgi:hypothetical protein
MLGALAVSAGPSLFAAFSPRASISARSAAGISSGASCRQNGSIAFFHRVLPSRFFHRVSLLASIAFRGFNVER